MPIRNYPFSKVGLGSPRPMLWIKVTNPATGYAFAALAFVDTGSDDCVFPAKVAIQLGHILEAVPPKEIRTASGKTWAYSHTSKIEILDIAPDGTCTDTVLCAIPNTPIDFAKGCDAFLLGRRKFLNKFVLTIDYPQQIFSIRMPQSNISKRKIKRRRGH